MLYDTADVLSQLVDAKHPEAALQMEPGCTLQLPQVVLGLK